MVSLKDLSSYDIGGSERISRLCAVPVKEVTGNAYISEYYPEINVNREMFNTSSSRMASYKSVLIPVNEHIIKRITRTFFESGFQEALFEARSAQSAAQSPIICSLAEYAHRIIDFLNKCKFMILPHLKDQDTRCITKYTQTRDWTKSCIRWIVWHPNCFKIAVAGSDDIIRIYKDEPAIVPVLKHPNQRSITCMAWRPYSSSELTVGCEDGICHWTIENSKPASQILFLKHPKHYPVIAVEWNPDGTLLASSSIGSADVLIWNVDMIENSPLRRVGPSCSLLKWSPDGSSLFSSTISNVFRVWSTDCWTPERWTINFGQIQSAAWSPCGKFLLFVTSEESFLYRLQFVEEQLFATSNLPKQALPIADLTKVTVGYRELGGLPQSIAWDPHGRYLAVIFKDTSCIAIFMTSLTKFNLNISPSCFLTGIGSEYPSFICFQSINRRNSDSVLTIGWSSGRIQYFPFVNI
ncbi:aladin [Condylostylus longicornis]|uniref:aladin n=1 Tax=Condylostylus longicornis TaxID=2530218 RepID=UPI00244DDA97|nr:aladin [Condylostylus longicornis]